MSVFSIAARFLFLFRPLQLAGLVQRGVFGFFDLGEVDAVSVDLRVISATPHIHSEVYRRSKDM